MAESADDLNTLKREGDDLLKMTEAENKEGKNGEYVIEWASKPLGFSIVPDKSGKNTYVSSINQAENIKKGVQLRAQIIEINGEEVTDIMHAEILSKIKAAETPIRIKFQSRTLTSHDYFELGLYNEGGGLGKSKKECYEESLRLDPKHAKGWRNLGNSGGGLGKSKKECYEEALKLDPKYAGAWNSLGYLGGGLGKSKKECYEEALKLDPKYAKGWRNLGNSGGGLGKSKKECYEEALRLDPKNAWVWNSLGGVGGGLGKSKKECAEESLSLDPKNAGVWFNLALEGGGLGKSKKECFEESARLDPKDPDVWRELGNQGGGLGKSKKECYEEALRLDPNDARARRALGDEGGGLLRIRDPDLESKDSSNATNDIDKSKDLQKADENIEVGGENVEAASFEWKADCQLVQSTSSYKHILNPKHTRHTDVESGFVLDISEMCPHLELITVQQLLLKFVIAKSAKEADKCLSRLLDEMIFPSSKIRKATVKKIFSLRKNFRKDMKREVKEEMNDEMKDEIRETAKEAFVNARLFLDESDEFQRAAIYFLDYDCKSDHHCDIVSMTSEEVCKKLQSYSPEDLTRANASRRKILEEWRRPDLMDYFPGLKRDDFNVVVCGKSGHGKSSLINLIGTHVGKSFGAKTDILECTMEASKYNMCPDFQVWDVPGHGTAKVPEGKDGELYIRNYSLTFFDLVVIVMAERETSFAAILYQQLVAQDIKLQVGAKSKQIFLCAAVPPHFDTPNLCKAMIEFFVDFKLPHVDEDDLEKMEENCSKGMTDAIMMKMFNLTSRQMQCFRSVLELKVIQPLLKSADFGAFQIHLSRKIYTTVYHPK